MSSPPTLAALAAALLLLATAASAANFTCSSTDATCQSAIGYAVPNATTYGALVSLFNTTLLPDLLGANNLPPSTPAKETIQAKATVRIPFTCRCAGGIGQSDRLPIYTVQPQDGLDAIARSVFDAFITYQEIALANKIDNPNLIQIGQKLWIPLPCSCDGADVMHYAYSVAGGDTTSGIAATFGVLEPTLLKLNQISDPKSLLKGQILDVPLPVCQSSISSSSPDHNLRIPNGTYALTAKSCVKCSCSANTYQLDCVANQGQGSTVCPAAPACNNGTLPLGQRTNDTGCASTTCAYSGYSDGPPLSIHTVSAPNQTLCKRGGSARSEFAGSMWRVLLISFHMVLIWICFL